MKIGIQKELHTIFINNKTIKKLENQIVHFKKKSDD